MSGTNNDHSGIGAVAGFGYQDYYYLLRLLKMKVGEAVSYEKIDDVGLEDGGNVTMFQLKHTINGYKDKVVRLNEKDTDLWKTIYVWIDIISKKGDAKMQKEFIELGDFILVTNKVPDENIFIKKLNDYQESKNFLIMQDYIQNLYDSSFPKETLGGTMPEENGTQKKIKALLDFGCKEAFLMKVRVECKSIDDLKSEIFKSLEVEKYTPKANVNSVYISLIGEVTNLKSETIYKGNELIMKAEDFSNKYSSVFYQYRGKPYNPKRYDYEIPTNPKNMTFLKQLVDIEDVDWEETDLINEYYQRRLSFENNYNDAVNYISHEGQKNFKSDALLSWNEEFRYHNRPIKNNLDENIIKDKARVVLKSVRSKNLILAEQELDEYHSNGCFYMFSDGVDPKIGWRKDWEDKYKKKLWITD